MRLVVHQSGGVEHKKFDNWIEDPPNIVKFNRYIYRYTYCGIVDVFSNETINQHHIRMIAKTDPEIVHSLFCMPTKMAYGIIPYNFEAIDRTDLSGFHPRVKREVKQALSQYNTAYNMLLDTEQWYEGPLLEWGWP